MKKSAQETVRRTRGRGTGKEIVTSDKVRVPVEVEMVALVASNDTLEKHIDQCYWPELSTSIYNSTTGEMVSLRHPLSAVEFIKLVTNNAVGEDFFRGDYASREDRLILVARNMRRWKFKVDVVLKNGRWLISSDLLPPEYWGLKRAIKFISEQVEGRRDGIKICAGLLPPPSVTYKESLCPPSRFPEKELAHGLDKLNILKTIQGE